MYGKRVEVIPSLAPAPFDHDKPGIIENLQMQHDRAAVELGHDGKQHACRAGAGIQCVEYAPAGTVPQGFEKSVILVVS